MDIMYYMELSHHILLVCELSTFVYLDWIVYLSTQASVHPLCV